MLALFLLAGGPIRPPVAAAAGAVRVMFHADARAWSRVPISSRTVALDFGFGARENGRENMGGRASAQSESAVVFWCRPAARWM